MYLIGPEHSCFLSFSTCQVIARPILHAYIATPFQHSVWDSQEPSTVAERGLHLCKFVFSTELVIFPLLSVVLTAYFLV